MELTVWLKTRVFQIVRFSADVESQSRCQQLTNAFEAMDTLGIDKAMMMTMQLSLTVMKILTFRAGQQAVHLRESKEQGKKGSSLAPRKRLLLVHNISQ